MISLGVCDTDVRDDDIARYLREAAEFTGASKYQRAGVRQSVRGQADNEWAKPGAYRPPAPATKCGSFSNSLRTPDFCPLVRSMVSTYTIDRTKGQKSGVLKELLKLPHFQFAGAR